MAYRELGRQMVLEELLPEPDLVFFLTHPELKAVAQEKSPGLVSKYDIHLLNYISVIKF